MDLLSKVDNSVSKRTWFLHAAVHPHLWIPFRCVSTGLLRSKSKLFGLIPAVCCYVCVHKIFLLQTRVRCWMVNLFWTHYVADLMSLWVWTKHISAVRGMWVSEAVLCSPCSQRRGGVHVFCTNRTCLGLGNMKYTFHPQIPNLTLNKLGWGSFSTFLPFIDSNLWNRLGGQCLNLHI